jgi:hypothetical protein
MPFLDWFSGFQAAIVGTPGRHSRRLTRPAMLRFEPLAGRTLLSADGLNAAGVDDAVISEPPGLVQDFPSAVEQPRINPPVILSRALRGLADEFRPSQIPESRFPAWARQVADRLVAEVVDRWRDRLGQPHEPRRQPLIVCGFGRALPTIIRAMPLPVRQPIILAPTPTDFPVTTPPQEVHVDEADVVAMEGNLLYVVRDGRLSILEGRPGAAPSLVAQIDIQSTGRVIAMHLDNGRVTIVARADHDEPWGTTVTVVDVTTPKDGFIVSRLGFDGHAVTSRMVGGRLCLVLQHDAQIRRLQDWLWTQAPAIELTHAGESATAGGAEFAPTQPSGWRNLLRESAIGRYESEQAFTERLTRGLFQLLINEIELPQIHRVGQNGEIVSSEPLLADVQDFEMPASLPQSLCTMTTIDVRAPVPATGSSVLFPTTGDPIVHASGDDLYPFTRAIDCWWSNAETEITTISFAAGPDGTSAGQVTARGRVTGTLLDQCSVDVWGPYLRVVLEHVGGWGTGTRLVILEQGKNALVETGRLAGLAHGEVLPSVQVNEDRVYLATDATIAPSVSADPQRSFWFSSLAATESTPAEDISDGVSRLPAEPALAWKDAVT